MLRKYDQILNLRIPQVKEYRGPFLSEEDSQKILSSPFLATEKLDGNQVSIYFTGKSIVFQKKSILFQKQELDPYDQFRLWLMNTKYGDHWNVVKPGTVVYGQLLITTNILFYDRLPDWYLVMDIWDGEKYLSWDNLVAASQYLGLKTVPLLSKKVLDIREIYGILPYTSTVGRCKAEGIVISNPELQLKAKVVRPGFYKEPKTAEKYNRLGETKK